MNKYDTVIVGAGAAGLMCAFNLASRQKKVALLDHSYKLAEKIRISGGGRCNFTNIYTSSECYISNNPDFCISPLSRYTPKHFCELLDKYSIAYHEKTLGQLFCNDKSEAIIGLLDFLCNTNKVSRQMGITINQIEKSSSGFVLSTTNGTIWAETLVIASGGLALPQIGATGFGYNIAKQFGISVIEPKPALVPLALNTYELEIFSNLSGISFSSEVRVNNISFLENTLLTHRGLSGPAILQISSYWESGNKVILNMLPNLKLDILLKENRSSNKLLSTFLRQFFSERLANNICTIIKIDKPLSQLSNKESIIISEFIHKLTLTPSGTLGHKKAEVTKGGVDTKKLSSKTMEAINTQGLYFIGEVVDVTGWLGGYNFQWAWSSAYVAGNSI